MRELTDFENILTRDGRLIYTNKGISMMPLLREDRDLMVIVKKEPERCKKFDAVLFKRAAINGKTDYVLHRILRVNRDGSYFIVGDNCYRGEIVREDQIIGVLSAVVRDGKTISVNDFRYWLYVHLWGGRYRLRKACNSLLRFAVAVKHRLFRD